VTGDTRGIPAETGAGRGLGPAVTPALPRLATTGARAPPNAEAWGRLPAPGRVDPPKVKTLEDPQSVAPRLANGFEPSGRRDRPERSGAHHAGRVGVPRNPGFRDDGDGVGSGRIGTSVLSEGI